MLKEYIRKKSKAGLAIDIVILILLILLLIPATRKNVAALILRPTLIIHQPKVNSDKVSLSDNAYAWKLAAPNGKQVSFSSMSDKVIFVNLWATWCPPCIAEMPDLQKLYNDYSDKVNFIFVSNEKQEVVMNFIKSKKYTLPVFIPVTDYPDDFQTNSLPSTFIISKDGEVIISKKGVAKWNSNRVRNILDALINK